MKTLISALLTFLVIGTSLEACVEVDSSGGTYTVDDQGCVNQ